MSEAGEHARLSCSGAARWKNCAGSVREESAYVDISGAAAIDGTGSHLLLELCLLDNCWDAKKFVGEVIGVNHFDMPNGWLVDEARAERVQMCLDYILRRLRELRTQFPHSKVEVLAESKTNAGVICGRDDWWGTADITIIVTAMDRSIDFIEIVDYKDGRGWVHVPNNDQLISYLAGKMGEYTENKNNMIHNTGNVGATRIAIVQPKTNPPVRYEDLEPYEVAEAHRVLSVAAHATDDPNAPLSSGKWCRWCKHKAICTVESSQSLETIMDLKILNSNVLTIDNEGLSKICSAKEGLMAIFDKAEEEMMSRLNRGDQISGYAIGNGKVSKKWVADEKGVASLLKSRKFTLKEVFIAKLVSPAAALKNSKLTEMQKKSLLKDHIAEVAGADVLKRVAHDTTGQSATEMFPTEEPVMLDFLGETKESEPVTEPLNFL